MLPEHALIDGPLINDHHTEEHYSLSLKGASLYKEGLLCAGHRARGD